ncbi:DUF4097 and DUF4098 domain-containing protein YvlB [Bacillus sp. SORGH_AS 510]|uniref:DUF4097 family beta strand repeat-containing protein n=1 Tax=Bacillus sp. SORGH_AS_0510 TaxID=3041771 RepID=UPI0027851C4E|nr:DUF4097 family beta strand repeat-containing protein [Bacillus sp. SORGH_AS_0510]MDQ1143866.1 DUF4097 and DUF4098 domain-containing protein YvlB [Bacillus sp. SORGH_AS_0510]
MRKLNMAIALLFTLVGCSSINNNNNNNKEEVKKFLPNEIKNVAIHSSGDNIQVKGTNESEIKVEINKKNKLETKKKGKTLTISVKEGSYINFKTATLTVYIPEEKLEHLAIHSQSGKISGNISNAENVTIDSDSSDISLKSFGGDNLRKSSIKTLSGSINVQLAKSENGYDIDANTTSGKITTNINMYETEKSSKNLHGYTGADGGDKSFIKLESASGEIELTE